MNLVDPSDRPPAAPRVRWLRVALVLVVYAALFVLGKWGSDWLVHTIGLAPGSGKSLATHMLWVGIGLYAVLLAIPFVPGMEISLALLAAFGSTVAVQIYAASVVALTASFLVGRLVPTRVVAATFAALGLKQAEELVRRLEPMSARQRVVALAAGAPRRWVPMLIRYRYLAVVLAFNLPGNFVLGGGGGIALIAGLSGMFSVSGFLLAVCVAVLPVPLAVLLFGHLVWSVG